MAHRISTQEIYDAAFDEEAFDHLLRRISVAVGARSAVAGWHYQDGTAALFHHTAHWHPDHVAEYERDYSFIDPWNVALVRNWRPNKATNFEDLLTPAEYERSALYNELFRRIGDDTYWSLALPIGNSWGKGAIAFHRGKSQKSFDADGVAFLDRYASHLRRLLTLRGKMSALELGVSRAAAALDRLGQAIFVVTVSGRIVQMNAAAEEMAAGSGPLTIKAGILCASASSSDRNLKDAMAKASAAADPEPAALAVHCSNGNLYLLSIIALPPSATGARHLLVIGTDPAAEDPSLEPRLRMLFNLTPGEACVAISLSKGASATEIAAERGVALGTVRSQIKGIAAKLDCQRQSDIVRIVQDLPRLHLGRS